MPSSSNLAPRGDGSWGAILSRIIETLVLDHVPVVVRLAVLLSLGASQKRDGANLSAPCRAWESGRSSLQPFLAQTEDAVLDRSIT
jgi:hypothetical protein